MGTMKEEAARWVFQVTIGGHHTKGSSWGEFTGGKR